MLSAKYHPKLLYMNTDVGVCEVTVSIVFTL